MSWSFRFARVFGIDLKVHATFVIVLGLGAVQWGGPHGAAGAAFGVLLMLALFACVLLHELGHSLAARAYGVPTKEIVLLPIGGVALLARIPKNPLQELLIAAAGPAVNVLILLVLLPAAGAALLASGIDPRAGAEALVTAAETPSLEAFLFWLASANFFLVAFNLIPAFPLDGGRMLRAALAFAMPHPRATRIAASVGQILAFGLGLFGIFSGNLLLALVALFIFIGAGSENFQVQSGDILSRLRAGESCNRHARARAPAATPSRAGD
jgi:Zn-dependent protease